MDWKLIDEFNRVLDSGGNSILEKNEPRRKLTGLGYRWQVCIAMRNLDLTDPDEDPTEDTWVDLRDIKKLIEYLESGERNTVDTTEEVQHLLDDLKELAYQFERTW